MPPSPFDHLSLTVHLVPDSDAYALELKALPDNQLGVGYTGIVYPEPSLVSAVAEYLCEKLPEHVGARPSTDGSKVYSEKFSGRALVNMARSILEKGAKEGFEGTRLGDILQQMIDRPEVTEGFTAVVHTHGNIPIRSKEMDAVFTDLGSEFPLSEASITDAEPSSRRSAKLISITRNIDDCIQRELPRMDADTRQDIAKEAADVVWRHMSDSRFASPPSLKDTQQLQHLMTLTLTRHAHIDPESDREADIPDLQTLHRLSSRIAYSLTEEFRGKEILSR